MSPIPIKPNKRILLLLPLSSIHPTIGLKITAIREKTATHIPDTVSEYPKWDIKNGNVDKTIRWFKNTKKLITIMIIKFLLNNFSFIYSPFWQKKTQNQ